MPIEKNITAQSTDEPSTPNPLDRNKITEPIQEPVQAVEIEAEVVKDDTITVKQIIDAVGLPKEQILEYHNALQDPSWHVEKSLSELNEQARSYIIANTEQVKQAIQNFINSKPKVINAEQLKRLQTIKSASGKTEEYFKQYLQSIHGINSSKSVLNGVMYDTVINWLETAPNAPESK
jgi:hypothetical protein